MEIIIVLGILGIFLGAGTFFSAGFISREYLRTDTENLIFVLREARSRAQSGYENDSWSIKFLLSEGKYVLFKGNDYETREIAFDREYFLNKTLSFKQIVFDGGDDIMTFFKNDGYSKENGEIILQNVKGASESVFVNYFGIISLDQSNPAYTGEIPIIPDDTLEKQTYNVFVPVLQDTYIDKGDEDVSFGSENNIWVQSRFVLWHKRGLLRFDLTAIPNDAQIVSAKLKLYVVDKKGSSRSYGIYKIIQNPDRDWIENEATWYRYKIGQLWTGGGGDYVETLSNTFNVSAFDGTPFSVQIDLTSDIGDLIKTPLDNYGWLIKDMEEAATFQYYVQFASKEHSQTGYRPSLNIVYEY